MEEESDTEGEQRLGRGPSNSRSSRSNHPSSNPEGLKSRPHEQAAAQGLSVEIEGILRQSLGNDPGNEGQSERGNVAEQHLSPQLEQPLPLDKIVHLRRQQIEDETPSEMFLPWNQLALMSYIDKHIATIPISSIVHKPELFKVAYCASGLSIHPFKKLVKVFLFAEAWDAMALPPEAEGVKMELYSGDRQIKTEEDLLMAVCVQNNTLRGQKLDACYVDVREWLRNLSNRHPDTWGIMKATGCENGRRPEEAMVKDVEGLLASW
ncbi:hypothetical protein BDZ45DRAFT_753507 [Acephala macrosclerotiorum]|nr:hypothetical protein BDZ45DRAFT_753507 [Acephala macrosclerotiorum]